MAGSIIEEPESHGKAVCLAFKNVNRFVDLRYEVFGSEVSVSSFARSKEYPSFPVRGIELSSIQ